jgi:hypothetical protein
VATSQREWLPIEADDFELGLWPGCNELKTELRALRQDRTGLCGKGAECGLNGELTAS